MTEETEQLGSTTAIPVQALELYRNTADRGTQATRNIVIVFDSDAERRRTLVRRLAIEPYSRNKDAKIYAFREGDTVAEIVKAVAPEARWAPYSFLRDGKAVGIAALIIIDDGLDRRFLEDLNYRHKVVLVSSNPEYTEDNGVCRRLVRDIGDINAIYQAI